MVGSTQQRRIHVPDEFGLNEQEQLFVREYLKHFNGTEAAFVAYPCKNSKTGKRDRRVAANHGHKILRQENVQQALAHLVHKRNEEVEVDATWVLKQAVKLHKRCMQEIKPKMVWNKEEKEWDHEYDEDGNAIYQFNATGAGRALELVGKHVDVQAFNEQSTVRRVYDDLTNEELHERLTAVREALGGEIVPGGDK